MFYLVTDNENRTFRDIQWGKNITHTEENPNYHFFAYHNPLVALYMYPCYEGTLSPKIWTCSGENPSFTEQFRSSFSSLTTLEEHSFTLPTIEKRITFGILCAMNLVLNPKFRNWALAYLRNEDRTKESAHKLSEYIIGFIGQEEDEYLTCVHAVLGSVMMDSELMCANAGHRAYVDSLELSSPLSLEQTIQIVEMLSPEEIASML